MQCGRHLLQWLFFSVLLAGDAAAAETFRVATYNVENYLDEATTSRSSKSPEGKAKVRESILAINPDVLALEEMGGPTALHELQSALKASGLGLPFSAWTTGFDTNIHLALLSRFPLKSVVEHTNDNFLLDGKRFRVSRGFLQAEIQVNTNFSFILLSAHLKSKRPIASVHEADLRLEEAKVLREKVDALLSGNPNANLVVLGDLNDNKDAPSTRTVIGRGKSKLLDTRPAERNGDNLPGRNHQPPRNIAWTHYYAVEDTYSRLDYILLSPGMAHEWVPEETYVLTFPNWGLGSDHRPIVATFLAEDR